jgi:hypothetical protein
MPGWNTTDNWHNSIAYTPGMWIRLSSRGKQVRRVPSTTVHAILMGQNTTRFQFLKDQGYTT